MPCLRHRVSFIKTARRCDWLATMYCASRPHPPPLLLGREDLPGRGQSEERHRGPFFVWEPTLYSAPFEFYRNSISCLLLFSLPFTNLVYERCGRCAAVAVCAQPGPNGRARRPQSWGGRRDSRPVWGYFGIFFIAYLWRVAIYFVRTNTQKIK